MSLWEQRRPINRGYCSGDWIMYRHILLVKHKIEWFYNGFHLNNLKFYQSVGGGAQTQYLSTWVHYMFLSIINIMKLTHQWNILSFQCSEVPPYSYLCWWSGKSKTKTTNTSQNKFLSIEHKTAHILHTTKTELLL